MPQVISNFEQLVTLPKFRNPGSRPNRLSNITKTALPSSVVPIDHFDGKLWGMVNAAATIYSSTDYGATWTAEATAPVSTLSGRLLKTSDGEVIYHSTSAIYKSSGWTADPSTATWTSKASTTLGGTTPFLRWGVDGDGTKFIAVEYGAGLAGGAEWTGSRKGFISTDSGTTWTQKWDSETINPGIGGGSHIHGACYDRFADRFYVLEGHEESPAPAGSKGLYCSTDDGDTWVKTASDFGTGAAPTTATATRYGLVLGTDGAPSGIWHFPTTSDPSNTEAYLAFRWKPQSVQNGVIGFAQRAHYDEDTGIVYVGFVTNFEFPPIIMASDGLAANTVYTLDEAAPYTGQSITQLVAFDGKLVAWIDIATDKLLRADTALQGFDDIDTGNAIGGTVATAATQSSCALGSFSNVGAATSSTAVGQGVDTSGAAERAIVVGQSITNSGSRATILGNGITNTLADVVMIGNQCTATGAFGIAIGSTAGQVSTGSIAIGYGSDALNTGMVVIGYNAQGTTNQATVVGYSASGGYQSCSFGNGAIAGSGGNAFGYLANCTFSGSMALAATATAASQLHIGAKHLEIDVVSNTTPPADGCRLQVMEDASGNEQLAVIFPTGGIKFIRTEDDQPTYNEAISDRVAQWVLDDNAASTTVVESLGNYNGTLTGAGNTSASNTTGPGSGFTDALLFDGTDDYINTSGTTAALNFPHTTGIFSIAFWMKKDANNTRYSILGNVVSTSERGFYVLHEYGAGVGDNCVRCAVLRAGSGTVISFRSADNTINDTNWHHVVMQNGSAADDATIYIDGVSVAVTYTTNFTSIGSGSCDREFNIGRANHSSSFLPFDGDLSNILLFDAARTAKQVTSIYGGP